MLRFLFILVSLIVLGCSDEKINLSLDSNSLERIMSKMTIEEQARFLEDGQLIMTMKGGDPYAINGYTVNQAREEAKAARRFIAKKNQEIVTEAVKEMIQKDLETIRLMQSPAGIYKRPEPGYLLTHRHEYRFDDLKELFIKNGGDLSQFEEMVKKEKSGLSSSVYQKGVELTASSVKDGALKLEGEGKKWMVAEKDLQSMKMECEHKLLEKEAEDIWNLMINDISSYIAKCHLDEQEIAQDFGGMAVDEAQKHARSVCQSLINERFRCMAGGQVKAVDCICGSDI